MKKLLLTASLAIAVGQLAFADIPELLIETGGNTVTVNGAANSNSVFYSNNFFGWTINLVFGNSSSPGLVPYGLALQTNTAECAVPTCADLHVWLSDTSFTQLADTFKTGYSPTDTGTSASTSQSAWVGGNTYFTQGSLIGTLGPFSGAGSFSGTAVKGIFAGPAPYSLTIEDTFTGCTGATCGASYTTTGNITGAEVPDGGTTIMLLGGVLVGLETLRRRFRS